MFYRTIELSASEMETTIKMSDFFAKNPNESLANLRVVRELSDPEIWMDSKVISYTHMI